MPKTTNNGIAFTDAALRNLEECGLDLEGIAQDLLTLTRNTETYGADAARASLLEACLQGADDDRHEGWREYVATLVAEVVTDDDLRRLGDEAHQAGDYKQRSMAYRAIGEGHNSPDMDARAECERIIRAARGKARS